MTSPHDPAPVRSSDHAALSAGWGALLGAVLVAARDKGDEPVRSAEVLPLGLAAPAVSVVDWCRRRAPIDHRADF